MALGSTIYNFEITLSDTTKDVYESISLRAAQHPSETLEFLTCRVLAYCLEYKENLEFSKGLEDPEQPALWAKDLTGSITHWIEIGTPSAEKIHKAAKNVAYVAIYTHKNPQAILENLNKQKIHNAENIFVTSFQLNEIQNIADKLTRRNDCEITFSEGIIYININGDNFEIVATKQNLIQPA